LTRFVTVVWLSSLAALAAQGPTFHGSIDEAGPAILP